MGLTIDDCISELTWVRKVNEEILKTDAKEIDVNSAWIEHWENVVKSLDVAIEIMRKYQKIKEILEDDTYYEYYGSNAEKFIVSAICEVLKNGNVD